VSVLINNYNYGRYLAAAVDSALAQEWGDLEVVVVDDGSTDGSIEVMRRYGDRIVSVAKANGGQASAFNAGWERATGEIVCLLDSDDWFLPGKVAAVAEVMRDHPSAEWCFHRLAYGGREGPSVPSGRQGWIDARRALSRGHSAPVIAPATSGLAFRSGLLERVFPIPESLRITADNYVKAVALSLSPGWLSAGCLAVQRIHEANAYTERDRTDAGLLLVELDIADALRSRWPHLRRYATARAMGVLKQVEGRFPSETVRDRVAEFVEGGTRRERARVWGHRQLWRARSVLAPS
jgi:glycosyltransferase involved in cell wall biosynthesis